MTEPNGSNPPNAQPPHAPSQPDSGQQQQSAPPVVNVQPQGPDTGVQRTLNEFGRTLAGMPEAIVTAFREATQPAVQPTNDAPSPASEGGANQGGNQSQAPGTSTAPPPPPASVADQATGGTGAAARGPSRVAKWFFGRS